jgi:hypothetical protein
MSTCEAATAERKSCLFQLDYTIEGKDGTLNCSEYCFRDCKNIGSNIISNFPKNVQFKQNDGSIIGGKIFKIVKVEFKLSFANDRHKRISWIHEQGAGWKIEFGLDFERRIRELARQGIIFEIQPGKELTLNQITRSFCRSLSTIPINTPILLKIVLTIEDMTVHLWNEIQSSASDDRVHPIFLGYPDGKYVYKSDGWIIGNLTLRLGSMEEIILVSQIQFTKNNEIDDFTDTDPTLFPTYSQLMDKIVKVKRTANLSHYISSTAKARVLDDVKYCSNPKEFFSQDELDEISEGDIITFILRSEKKKPLVICLDKDSLFEYWKLEDSGQGWLYGKCSGSKGSDCDKFYKIPGDITLLIDETAKDSVIELWNSKNHYTMFDLKPLEKVQIGRGIHYVGEASGEQTVYDVVPVALYIPHK